MSTKVRRIVKKGKNIIKSILPYSMKHKLRLSSVGNINFGDLRKLQPIDPDFGFSRGKVIDRYYIEKFLTLYSKDIRGRVLELGDSTYTKQFGGNRVTHFDVLHYLKGNPEATIIGDLTKADNIESNTFDCIILTQTLQMIYDVKSAIKNIHRILKPNGVILMTSHGTSKVCRTLGNDSWGEYWRFTGQSSKIMFEEFFKPENVTVSTYGNVLTAISFLHGLSVEDLSLKEVDYHDPRFEVLVGVRAVK